MKNLYRWIIYLAGLLILALGLILNTKAGLGVSPIISVSYSISEITHTNFANMTMVLYCIFVIVELILHKIAKRDRMTYLMDVLQIPLSLIFTRFMNLFSGSIPDFATEYQGQFLGTIAGRLLVLVAALILTGIGAALSLNVRMVPNPGDGIVQAIADTIGKSVGFTKNCFDLFNICLTTILGLVFAGHLVGIGIGTVIAVICVGRVIAIFNHFTYAKLMTMTGIQEQMA